MNIEQALKTAIEMEEHVQAFYKENAETFNSEVASQIFTRLAEEEQGHVNYLKRRHDKWLEKGILEEDSLKSFLPDKDMIENKLQSLSQVTDQADVEYEVDVFKQALKLEQQISAYYKKLVAELPEDDRSMFEGFLHIEESHEAIIQAEILSAISSGIWFDFMELDEEAG
jgi:rubrerythrin